MHRSDRRGEPRDRGETLVELLMTIAVLGITIPALLGAVLLTVAVSTQDRRQAQAQQALISWSEIIARENKTDMAYTNLSCSSATAYYATSPFAPVGLPSGFSASVAAISFWNTASGTFSPTCTTPDSGARKLQLKVTVAAGLYPTFTVSQSIVVRKLCLAC